jgi:hypothetical protein
LHGVEGTITKRTGREFLSSKRSFHSSIGSSNPLGLQPEALHSRKGVGDGERIAGTEFLDIGNEDEHTPGSEVILQYGNRKSMLTEKKHSNEWIVG